MSNFTRDFKRRFLPLDRKLRRIEDKIAKLVVTVMTSEKRSIAYWNAAKRELNVLYVQMNKVFADWSVKEIPHRFKSSVSAMQKRFTLQKSILNKAQMGVAELLRTNAASQIVHGLYNSSIEAMVKASISGRANLLNLFRATQQTLVDESLVNAITAAAFESGNLRIGRDILSAVLKSPDWMLVGKKQFVQAGKMKYSPRYYAELVARTKFHQAQSQAGLMQCHNYDTDLIQVSSHNTTTKICIPYEGRIFSLSGKDPHFPPLEDTSPFHPNCLHLMYPTFESAMKIQGTLDSFSDFSLGEVSRPPIPASFIPIGDRKIA